MEPIIAVNKQIYADKTNKLMIGKNKYQMNDCYQQISILCKLITAKKKYQCWGEIKMKHCWKKCQC